MPSDLEYAAELLRTGRLVVRFRRRPSIRSRRECSRCAAVQRILRSQGLPPVEPTDRAPSVNTIAMARDLAGEWPHAADLLAEKFWPGPLTIMGPKMPNCPGHCHWACHQTVGLRIPAHPTLRALLEAAGIPTAAPSANRFTEFSPTTADHVRARVFGDAVTFILDGDAWHGGNRKHRNHSGRP